MLAYQLLHTDSVCMYMHVHNMYSVRWLVGWLVDFWSAMTHEDQRTNKHTADAQCFHTHWP